jgi:Fur family ferric uptake transcriptional regulator
MEKILQEHGIKPTANRLLVLRALSDFHRPVTMAELEDSIDSIDKSGIFRTLALFKEHHLLHQIEDGCEGVRYELCHAKGETDDDRHVHFHCEICHRTFCLENLPIPQVAYPAGYEVESVNYMAKGVCPDCARKRDLKPIHTELA